MDALHSTVYNLSVASGRPEVSNSILKELRLLEFIKALPGGAGIALPYDVTRSRAEVSSLLPSFEYLTQYFCFLECFWF